MTDRTDPPIVCDMTSAPDTPAERLAEYRQLFTDALIGREPGPDGSRRFRLRNAPGIEDRVRALAAKEKACCAFFDFVVTAQGDEIWWDATTVDDPVARRILDQFHQLPDTVNEGAAAAFDRFAAQGLTVVTGDDGVSAQPRPGS